tara:strand:+ start:1418 stop:2377 length:960 start_codon:yes stop_codon:yes gene_type:complete
MKKIGIIGCGRQAPKHIMGYLENGIKDIFLFDVVESRARDLAVQFNIKHKKIEDLLRKGDIDIYSICTPPNTHDGIIKKLIDNNKHLLCEKPLSLNLDNLIEYEHLAKEKGLTVMGGYIYKFSPSHIKMKEFIEANQSRVTKAYFRIASPGIQSGWQYSKNQGGGVINELFVHMIDLANWYFGPIENIEEIDAQVYVSERVRIIEKNDILAEDFITVRMQNRFGVSITIEADMISNDFVQYVNVSGPGLSGFCSIQPNLPLVMSHTDKKNNICEYGEFKNLHTSQIRYFLNCIDQITTHSKSTISESISICKTINKITD